jgi:hypothetical protein
MKWSSRPLLAVVFLLQSLAVFALGDPGHRRAGIYIGTLLSPSGPVAGAVVRVLPAGDSAVTNAAGRFHLRGVGEDGAVVEISFGNSLYRAALQPFSEGRERGRGVIAISDGGPAVVPVSPRGHSGAEIEGLVQSVDSGGGSLTVADERLGTVTVTVTDSTEIRHGDTAIPLSQIQMGWRVHVKGPLQADGTYAATEIIVQDENVGGGGGETEASGTVQSVDPVAMSFTITESDGTVVTIDTDASTVFTMGGQPASFSDIAAGQTVEVEGTAQADGSILASHVSIEVEETEISGTVQSVDPTTMSFTVQEEDGTVVTVDTDASTIFRLGSHLGTFSDVAAGDMVEVTGTTQADGSILASRVNIEAPETEPVEIEGTVFSIDTGTGTFVVTTDSGNVNVATNGDTRWHGQGHPSGIGDLMVGDQVQVEGTMQSDGSLLASSVDIGD